MSAVIRLLEKILIAIEKKETPKQKHSGIGYNGVK